MSLDPAGTSVQNMNHWGQMIRENTFCRYSYLGPDENRKVGTLRPKLISNVLPALWPKHSPLLGSEPDVRSRRTVLWWS